MHTDRSIQFQPALSGFMDAARWIAALAVVLSHVNAMLVPLLRNIDDPTRFEKGWGFITGFSHHAVVVFFVLSGFLVGGKVLRELRSRERPFSPRRYFLDRFTRIYLVLIPVLLITAAADAVGRGLLNGPTYVAFGPEHYAWPAYLGALFSQQEILTPTPGYNHPLYTLANEFWYYLIFPMIVAPLAAPKSWKHWAVTAFGCALLIFQAYREPWHGIGFGMWLVGALIAAAPASRRISKPLVGVLAFVAVLVLIRVKGGGSQNSLAIRSVHDYVVTGFFAYLLFAVKSSPDLRWKVVELPINARLADFSYSLYASHLPVLALYSTVIYQGTGFGYHTRATAPWHWGAVVLAVLLLEGIGFGLGQLTERNTKKVRKLIGQWAERPHGTVAAQMAPIQTTEN